MYSYKQYLKYVQKSYTEINNTQNKQSFRETPIDISGKWYSNWGDMYLSQDGNKITGTYAWKNGKLEGTLEGNTLRAIWAQGPTYDYPSSKGDVTFVFAPTIMSFTGNWGYTPVGGGSDILGGAGGGWIGTRGNYPTLDGVDGSWKLSDGRLMLEQGNNKVVGIYIKDKSMDYIYISGDIKSTNNNIYIVEGSWVREPNKSCPNDSGKFDMKINKTTGTIMFRYANCDENIADKDYKNGYKLAGPEPINVAGLWETNEGKMLMELDGGILAVSYQRGKSLMEGRLIGNIFFGDWYTAETFNCPYSRGKAILEFNSSATSFAGYYTYCDKIYDENKKLSGIINR